MKLSYDPGGYLFYCLSEAADKPKLRCLMNPKQGTKPTIEECIIIEDSEDELEVENAKCPLKIKEVFPCGLSAGCNENRTNDEPEHLLRCLIVKILKESDTHSVHIETICVSLSELYKYFSQIPIYKLVQQVRKIISDGGFPNQTRIILEENQQCVLLQSEYEEESESKDRCSTPMRSKSLVANVAIDDDLSAAKETSLVCFVFFCRFVLIFTKIFSKFYLYHRFR